MRIRWGLVVCVLVCAALTTEPTWAFSSFVPSRPDASQDQLGTDRPPRRPTIRAHRIEDEPIRLDGLLDDPAWVAPERGSNFVMFEPERGIEPTQQTVFKVVYDEDAIYFGVACYETDPSKTSSTLTRRDRLDNSDQISIYIDPYLDQTTGYNFRVNPHGVLEDAYIYNDGERDRDWDAVWQAETFRDDKGWYAEVRIPFSSIRYRSEDSMTWGLQIYRWMHGRGEDNGWAYWDRETRGFVSRFGTITGIENIRSPRQFEVTPYVLGRTTDPSMDGPDSQQNLENFGADIKYGMTSDLTLNATIMPDFGQVEADPSVLNLSPFETFFEEKRPFFIEGSRFFQHNEFNLFYSRRIGTENAGGLSRIRLAGKVTGKSAGGISVAALAATTDNMPSDQLHQLFKTGNLETNYFVTRFGKEFKDGAHRVNVMQTGVVRPGQQRTNAYTSGADFDLNFRNRMFNVNGSFVGSILEPGFEEGPKPRNFYGTGGAFNATKASGTYRGGLWGRWEGDQLDLKDIGFLSAPDEVTGGVWLQYRMTGQGEKPLFTNGNVNFNLFGSTLYAGNTRSSASSGDVLWAYDRFHNRASGGNINGWGQLQNFWQVWYGVWNDWQGTSQYETRGGPLMTTPQEYGLWIGGSSDFRSSLTFDSELNLGWNEAGKRRQHLYVGMRWNSASWTTTRLSLGFDNTHFDAQHISAKNYAKPLRDENNPDNFITQPGGVGIDGTSYLFGELDARTFDVTLRTDVLFSRNQSLELYAQPFLSVGSYRNPRELVTPDSYDLVPYAEDGAFQANAIDFNGANLNINLVYRWEYRPGSTLFLVWTHARNHSEDRAHSGNLSRTMRAQSLFDTEPENTLLAKLTYWFSI